MKFPFTFFLITVSLANAFAQHKLNDKPPNIIFFFTDDQAYDTQKDYGNPDVKTPNLDNLAKQGMVFLRHYNTTAICMASRASVMTGQYEYKTGCNFDHGPLGTEQWAFSYPVLLKQAGYRIGFGGKFGFSISDDRKTWGEEGDVAQHYFDFWAGGPWGQHGAASIFSHVTSTLKTRTI